MVRGERFYRLLLRLFPGAFRRRYAAEMIDFYRARRAAVRGKAVAGLWLRIVMDVIGSATLEHADTARFNPSNRVRRTGREATMDTLKQDLRLALRGLGRAPGFTAVVLITLALGIGANAAIFSVVHAVLLKPLPYQHADRIEMLWHSNRTGRTYNAISPPEYFDFKEQLRAFDAVVAIRGQSSTILGDGGEPERLSAYVVTPNLFEALGATPAMGRSFRPDDGAAGAEKVIIISDGLWRRRFGADPKILGRTVNIGGFIRTIVGVMPREVGFPDAPLGFLRNRGDFWIPSDYESARATGRGNQYIAAIARRRADVTEAAARADLELVSARLRAAFPDRYGEPAVMGWRMTTVPLRDQMVGSVRTALWVLAGAVGLVLLIACVNVANLLLARGALRQREVAVRLALGANRGRLLRQTLTESTLLSLGGGLLGVLLARVGVPLLLHLDRGNIPRIDGTRLSGTVLGFAFGISLLTGLIVGVVPALQQSRTDLRGALGEGSRGAGDGMRRRRLRSALVAAQVAMALVVLVAAGLLGRSFAFLQRVEPGFSPGGVVSLTLNLPRTKYDSAAKVTAFFDQVTPALAAIPGVVEVGGIYPLPLSGEGWSGSFEVEGLTTGPGDAEPHAEYSVALPGYFHTMGIPLRAGREFAPTDTRGAPRVAVVDERLAARYWPGESAVGKRINAGEAAGNWATVVGVVGHVHRSGPTQESEPQLYVPFAQHVETTVSLVLRTNGDPGALAGPIRGVVRTHDPDLPTAQLQTLNELVTNATARQRFNMLMLTVFALVALGLASVGLYGVMSYLVSQRNREIGIRIALGGQPADVRRLVLRESLWISVGGLVAGAAASLALSRLLTGLLYGIKPIDVPTYAGIGALLLTVAALASYGPARRATRVDPLVALRE